MALGKALFMQNSRKETCRPHAPAYVWLWCGTMGQETCEWFGAERCNLHLDQLPETEVPSVPLPMQGVCVHPRVSQGFACMPCVVPLQITNLCILSSSGTHLRSVH